VLAGGAAPPRDPLTKLHVVGPAKRLGGHVSPLCCGRRPEVAGTIRHDDYRNSKPEKNAMRARPASGTRFFKVIDISPKKTVSNSGLVVITLA